MTSEITAKQDKEQSASLENKYDAILEMLQIIEGKVTLINNRFSRLAQELGYKA